MTVKNLARVQASSLTRRAIVDKLAAIQMVESHQDDRAIVDGGSVANQLLCAEGLTGALREERVRLKERVLVQTPVPVYPDLA